MAEVRKQREEAPKLGGEQTAATKSIAPPRKTMLSAMLEKKKNGTTEENARRVTTTGIGKEKPPVIHSETVATKEIVGSVGEVSIAYGLTIGLARKFEFARIDVSVRVPFGEGGRDAAYEEARQWAQEKMQMEVSAVRKMESGTGSESETDPAL